MEISLDENVNLHVTRVFNYQDLRKKPAKQMELGLEILQNVYVSLKHLSNKKNPPFPFPSVTEKYSALQLVSQYHFGLM